MGVQTGQRGEVLVLAPRVSAIQPEKRDARAGGPHKNAERPIHSVQYKGFVGAGCLGRYATHFALHKALKLTA